MHVLELKNPKVLIRSNQAESTKRKKMWLLEKRGLKRICYRTKLLELLQRSGGKTRKSDSESTGLTGSSSGLTGRPVTRPVGPVRPVNLEVPPKAKHGLVLKKSWLNMRSMELSRRRRSNQVKPRMWVQHQNFKSNWFVVHIKVIIMGRLLPGFTLIFIRLWIIVGCICNHITFNILLCI